ncbi:mitochondrial cobalamin adenosyltransferase [Andalucia godoyi]|uniref:Corrinoid adenosyltransferase MMAB n=1 Tax=Andalucia godoyi TaxID=505711 RepID=A0A8K0AI97_ANDGO|nr:mitochondrial cobalamin adenosyltransferase [Andalucia godoyi]|eukprot:ANDGO_07500.mRNA.1 mitochondrial cobalamin adenosyltransferase
MFRLPRPLTIPTVFLVRRVVSRSTCVARSMTDDSAAPTAAQDVKKSKIYTRTGDRGTSGLFNGTRASKDNMFFEALGTTDEVNAVLGVAREYLQSPISSLPTSAVLATLDEQLSVIQSRLLDLGSAIATPIPTSDSDLLKRVQFPHAHVADIESWIDVWDSQLPPLTNFILPSGGLASAHLHHGRTVCRRAERSVVQLVREDQIPAVVQIYLNRLSDYLFVVARIAAKEHGRPEHVYKKQIADTSQ